MGRKRAWTQAEINYCLGNEHKPVKQLAKELGRNYECVRVYLKNLKQEKQTHLKRLAMGFDK